MGELSELLRDASRSGVYRADDRAPAERAAREAGLVLSRIALAGVQDKTGLLKAAAASLAFPEWFGENWDALEDCLADLSWLGGRGHLLLFDGLESLPPDDLGILVDVLAASAEAWAARGKAFFCVFVDPPRELALPGLLRPQ